MEQSSEAHRQWPPIQHETLPWHRDPDELMLMPKSARRRIASTYEAALPLRIAGRCVVLPQELAAEIADVRARLAQFDEQQRHRGYDLPALLLRSESSASSQIEQLTSSVRNVAMAEVSSDAPANARLIAGNVAAMRRALALEGDLSVDDVCAVHRALMEPGGESFGGCLRDEQVWVGGTAYSPHGALYVPPRFELVPDYLEDLVAYAARDDVEPIVQAAVLHAQFETVHPFIDGNGRTGRALVHRMLRRSSVLEHATIPISAGLLHNIDAYMDALQRYQQGDPLAVVEQLVAALNTAVVLAERVARSIDEVLDGWYAAMTERKGSSIYRLPSVLVEQPVVNSAYLAERLRITPRATTSLIARACEYGMLRPIGNRHRGELYQADALIDVLEEVSSMAGIRRMLAAGW